MKTEKKLGCPGGMGPVTIGSTWITGWMSQEVSKRIVHGLKPTEIKCGILMYIGEITHLLTIYLQTSWDVPL